jgi:type II secretion system protein J
MRRHSRSGFTLLEMMLAMIIVAFLVPILYHSLRTSFESKKQAELAVEPARSAESAMDIVRQDVANAMPPTGLMANAFIGTNAVDNRGRDADDLLFFTTADAPQDGAGLVNAEIKQVELTIITLPNGDHALVRKVTRDVLSLLSGNTGATQPDTEVICRGVGGFNVRYYDGVHWGEAWDSTQTTFNNELPAAVEITLTMDRPNGAIINPDGTRSFRYVRIIPLACSYAPYDTTLNTGFNE